MGELWSVRSAKSIYVYMLVYLKEKKGNKETDLSRAKRHTCIIMMMSLTKNDHPLKYSLSDRLMNGHVIIDKIN